MTSPITVKTYTIHTAYDWSYCILLCVFIFLLSYPAVINEQRQGILAAGCGDVVNKPFKDNEIFETMARMLDIEYLYEEHGEEAVPSERTSLTKEMLADLPEELFHELREAALKVISLIAVEAPDVATGLKGLVDNYQMDQLRDLLG